MAESSVAGARPKSSSFGDPARRESDVARLGVDVEESLLLRRRGERGPVPAGAGRLTRRAVVLSASLPARYSTQWRPLDPQFLDRLQGASESPAQLPGVLVLGSELDLERAPRHDRLAP